MQGRRSATAFLSWKTQDIGLLKPYIVFVNLELYVHLEKIKKFKKVVDFCRGEWYSISRRWKSGKQPRKERKRSKRGCKKSWKRFLTNNKRHDRMNELLLRTKATRWTLKMKDWTVFKTLKILIKKSLWLDIFEWEHSETKQTKQQ